jgi:thioredoxin reductase (NADPH)
MMNNFKEQAIRFGVQIRTGSATAVDFTNPAQHQVTIDNLYSITADAVIIATWKGWLNFLKRLRD